MPIVDDPDLHPVTGARQSREPHRAGAPIASGLCSSVGAVGAASLDRGDTGDPREPGQVARRERRPRARRRRSGSGGRPPPTARRPRSFARRDSGAWRALQDKPGWWESRGRACAPCTAAVSTLLVAIARASGGAWSGRRPRVSTWASRHAQDTAKVAARRAASRARARTARVMVRTGRCGRVDYHSRPRGCGGIGRRARFRSVWGKPRGGSSPLIRIAHPLGPRRARQGPGRSQTGSAAGNALARAAGIRAGKRRAKEAVFGLVSHGFVPRRDRDSRPPQSAFDVGTMSSRRRLLPSSPRPSGVLRRRGGHFSPGELDVAAGPA